MSKKNYEYERYNVTVDWLKDFCDDLLKKSYNNKSVENIRGIFDKQNKFNSIDEKMADIRKRIGFDLIARDEDDSAHEKTAAESCSCNNTCGCKISVAHDKEDVEIMSGVLSYIKNLIKHEYHPDINALSVIARCKNEDGLRFDDIKINMEKLKSFIDKEIGKYDNNEQSKTVSYTPTYFDDSSTDSDKEADYYGHASVKAE